MAVKTVAQLKTTAAVIRDETAISGNTKLRVYNMLVDMIDSFCLILDITTVSTVSSTITFDFELKQIRKFLGSASFTTPKTIAFANSGNALEFDFVLSIGNAAAILTFDSSVMMNDIRFDSISKQWTPDQTGHFKGHAEYDGTNWLVDISQSPYA